MLRALAILLVFTFALLRVDAATGFRAPVRADSITQSAKAPTLARYVESTATRGTLVVQVDLLRLAAFHPGYSFGLTFTSRALPPEHVDTSVERLVDRRALIRRRNRVQHRSPSPLG